MPERRIKSEKAKAEIQGCFDVREVGRRLVSRDVHFLEQSPRDDVCVDVPLIGQLHASMVLLHIANVVGGSTEILAMMKCY